MSFRDRIICQDTGAEFKGDAADARAAGWTFGPEGWTAPSHGWDREPRRPISTQRVEYANGIDWQ